MYISTWYFFYKKTFLYVINLAETGYLLFFAMPLVALPFRMVFPFVVAPFRMGLTEIEDLDLM